MKNREKCPICCFPIVKPNNLLRYHVRYEPPIEIFACKYCNWMEYSLRHKLSIKDPNRAVAVRRYMLKFGIQL